VAGVPLDSVARYHIMGRIPGKPGFQLPALWLRVTLPPKLEGKLFPRQQTSSLAGSGKGCSVPLCQSGQSGIETDGQVAGVIPQLQFPPVAELTLWYFPAKFPLLSIKHHIKYDISFSFQNAPATIYKLYFGRYLKNLVSGIYLEPAHCRNIIKIGTY